MKASGSLGRSLVRASAAFAAAALLVFSVGCTTPSTTSAPRSNVSRANALSLAQLTANSVGGQVFTIAATGSMKPTLDESSVVTVEKVAFADLQRGDIVIYRSLSGAPIIHRLYEQHGQRWLVLGDSNGSIDSEVVTETNFVGRVCAIFYTSTGGGTAQPAALARK